jgi:hypothetical protein
MTGFLVEAEGESETRAPGYFFAARFSSIAACAAARRAVGTR